MKTATASKHPKYTSGDNITFTKKMELLVTPFSVLKISEGSGATILKVDGDYYLVRRRGSEFMVDMEYLEEHTEIDKIKEMQYRHIVGAGLSYPEAMYALIKQGKKVTRKIWGGYWYMERIEYKGDNEPQNVESVFHKVIMAKLKNGGYAVATPYQDDMLATDWMVVE